jgi:nicotinamide-nucleotide amidase
VTALGRSALNAEIIAIGTELLLGEIVDTNSARIARALRNIGLDLLWISAVGDNEARIAEAVDRARRRSAVVITSGGLGPTVDDPTRAAVARAFGLSLEYRDDLWYQIEARYQRFGRRPTENNRKQAYVPAGAIALENPVGTAPCFVVEHEGGLVIALPGVPRELEFMLEHSVLPLLRQRLSLNSVIRTRILRTVGIGESLIDARISELEILSNPTVGLAAHAGQTDVRITAKATTAAEADALIAPVEAEVRARLGDFIYGVGTETVEAVVARMLADRNMTVAVREIGTLGRLAERLRAAPHSAQIFRDGQPSSRENVADMSAALLAQQARQGQHQEADWGLGVIASQGQDGIQLQMALASAEGTEQVTLGYGGHPALADIWASTSALNMLRLALLREGAPPAG